MDAKVLTTPSLTLKRRLNATPAQVFRAWTDPALLTRWFGPENVETIQAELDPRIGGVYRIVMLENNGERHQVQGSYQEVVENERLVFSWSWISTPERVSKVTVTLKPDGHVTILTLLHEQLFDEKAVAGHTHGWTGSLVKLEAFLPDRRGQGRETSGKAPGHHDTGPARQGDDTMTHDIVSREDWLVARKAHLAAEKAFTRARDQLSAERRALPWVQIEKHYRFEGPNGPLRLADLFGDNSQLLIYHFMFAAGWSEGCPGCSFLADHFDGANQHLRHHDVSLVAVSRAPYAEFQPFRRRMGWQFDWVSSAGSDFNHDFHVSPSPAEQAAGRYEYNYEMHDGQAGEMPGFSAFQRDEAGAIFHTYSSYGRGGDLLIGTYNFLDMMPKGRNEETTMEWMRHHDRYEEKPAAASAALPLTAVASCCG